MYVISVVAYCSICKDILREESTVQDELVCWFVCKNNGPVHHNSVSQTGAAGAKLSQRRIANYYRKGGGGGGSGREAPRERKLVVTHIRKLSSGLELVDKPRKLGARKARPGGSTNKLQEKACQIIV